MTVVHTWRPTAQVIIMNSYVDYCTAQKHREELIQQVNCLHECLAQTMSDDVVE